MITITKYQIRASNPQPVAAGCPSTTPSSYVYQTFGAMKQDTDIYEAVTEIKKSSAMQGQNPTDNVEDATYIANTFASANYSGRPLRTTDGDMVFSATENHVEEFVSEDLVPGWS